MVSVQKTRQLLWLWGNTIEYIARKREEEQAFAVWAEDAADVLKAQRITDMPRGGVGKDFSDVIAELERRRQMYAQAECKIHADIENRIRLKETIDELIEHLKPIQQSVLRLRYQDGHQWDFIALKLVYDESSVRRIETEAVKEISKVIDLV